MKTVAFKACEGNDVGPQFVAYLVEPGHIHAGKWVSERILSVRFSGATEEEARATAIAQWEKDLAAQLAKEERARKMAASRTIKPGEKA
jgi:hypothetical protein